MSSRARRLVPLIAAVVAGIVAGAAWWSTVLSSTTTSSGPTLVFPTDGGGQGMDRAEDVSYGTFAVGDICISEPGSVRIVRVEPVNAEGGATFTDFSAYSLDEMADYHLNTRERLGSVRQFTGSDRVTDECGTDGPPQSLALELHKPGSASVVARSFRIVYETGDDTRTLEVPWRTSICNQDSCT